MAETVGKRPFWLHQLAEYILGLALVVVGVQSPTPFMPCLVAAVIIIHAAITVGPFGAFRVIPRGLHRVIDVGVIAFEVFAALQPFISIEGTTRMIMLAIAFVHAFIWWQSNFLEKVRKQVKQSDAAAQAAGQEPLTGRSADVGRTAGRVVGSAVRAAREVTGKGKQPPPG